MKNTLLGFAMVLLASMGATPAAANYCGEKPTQVIINDTRVYFTTDKSCPSWCVLPLSWSDEQIDRAVSMLLSAISQDKTMTFYWSGQATYCAVMPVYSEPEVLIFF